MAYESIGIAKRSPSPEEQHGGISFMVPYGATSYDIKLKDVEMDRLLLSGVRKVIGNSAVSGFDYVVKLERGDLPLYIGANSLQVEGDSGRFHDAKMGVSVVSRSYVNEHRGILLANRSGYDGKWSFIDYEVQPPLKHREQE